MARIAGVDLPKKERVEIGLTRIFGIGRSTSKKILTEASVNPNIRVNDLSNEDIAKIRGIIDRDLKVEGDLRKEVSTSIKRLTDIGCYRGVRHKTGLPVRGQRTKTNARTRRGPSKGVVKKKGGK
ncbi:MAG: 30S ribosomal protein S13 [Candidatus Magnetobacterium sp. LHC-1]|uniref:Small ribosomal subunit protein uS13 n=1 Tax=Candidatus Magnetobacterium casense TaxID=1455061 RepID=A0ABS6RVM7_9BACT|nr:30S ribosomal protein S13 [Candidatus Magnetobacterium casensis]MBF0607806.1 30S ribosomal protein S13 [Nitrospirota bacterium]MBV6340682.1 30S ribosomal protein S13 [Candidatus Magnetobacterium casensis]